MVTQEYFDNLILSSLEEMRKDYYFSVKKAIVDYTLTNPTERERLGEGRTCKLTVYV